jgi:Asparagine synthase
MWWTYALAGAAPHRLHQALRRARGHQRYAPPWLSEASGRLYFSSDDPWAWKSKTTPRWWGFLAYLLTGFPERSGVADYLRQRGSMAGMDARPPLLDVDLIEFALRVPPRLNFDPLFDRPLIRRSLSGRVPESVRLSIRKNNLLPFYHQGLAGPDLPALRRLLGRRDAEVGAYVRRDVLERALGRVPRVGEAGWTSWVSMMWPLASAECWLRYQADPAFIDEAAGWNELRSGD